jgi:signal transduction histidine kinase
VARDISERKALESQLLQTQKLESLGVLAGGVAHDFNNLLTGILGNASLVADSMPPSNPNHRILEECVKAAERAAHLTRQLLAYAGKGQFVIEAVNLSSLVKEISSLVQTSIPRKVQVRLELEPDLPAIEADTGQLQQVIMNLVINAAEAIGDNVGLVVVTTGQQEVNERYSMTVWGHSELRPGRYVTLEVHDSGCGMDEATLQRIFDPFFTTKFTGRGLGLAAVSGIMRSHKGAMKVYSVPGKGTTFKLLFPATSVVPTPPSHIMLPSDAQGSGTILVVDDEEIVRDTARNTLERYGYRILMARDGREAIELFREVPTRSRWFCWTSRCPT